MTQQFILPTEHFEPLDVITTMRKIFLPEVVVSSLLVHRHPSQTEDKKQHIFIHHIQTSQH